MLTTTPTALLLIKAFEGFKNQTYFDSAGIPTIGFGTTRFQNGDKVALGDEITEDEAEAELFYHIRREVEPALTRLFEGLALQPNQRDALASFMYNLGGSGDKWPTLKRLIQEGAPSPEIADQWMKYHRAGGNKVLGLFRRRMAEVLVWLGWAWDKAFNAVQNVEMDQDWRGVAGYQDAAPDVDAELFDELEIPKRGADPIPSWDQLTDAQKTAWLNGDQKSQLETAPKTVQRTKPVGPAPAPAPKPIALEEVKYGIHDPADVGFKPMKVTKRYKGAKNADNGKEMAAVAGTLGGVAAMAGSAKEVTGYFAAYDIRIILVTVFVVSAIGLMIGAVRWWHGRMQEHKGREEASQAMV